MRRFLQGRGGGPMPRTSDPPQGRATRPSRTGLRLSVTGARLSRSSIELVLASPVLRHWVGVWATAAGLAILHAALHRLLAYVLLQAQAMVVMSCAPFALAFGGALLARPDRRGHPFSLAQLALAVELSVVGCVVLASRIYLPGVLEVQLSAQLPLLLFGLGLSVPFVVAGRVLVTPIAREPETGPVVVSAGFIGVCVGSLLAAPLIDGAGAPGAVASSTAFFALATTAWTRGRARARVAVLSFSIALLAFGLTGIAEFPVARGKAMADVTRAEQGEVAYRRWTPFERIDVVRFDPPRVRGELASMGAGRAAEGNVPGHYLVTRDGDLFAAMYEWDGELSSLQFYQHHLLASPYRLLEQPQVLVLQGVGGIDALTGLAHGVQGVRLSMSNPSLLEVGQEVFRDFNGDLLHHAQVETVVGGGRVLLRDPAQYDLISLHWDYNEVPLGLGMLDLSENQLNTREALQTYLARLQPHGVLAISLVDHGRGAEEGHHLRLLRTVMQVLQRGGVADGADHIAVIASVGMPRLIQMLVRQESFSEDERSALGAFALEEGFELGFGTRGARMLAGELALRHGVEGDARWPVATDDTPFFFDLGFWEHAFDLEMFRALWQPRVPGLSLPALIASVWIGVLNALLVMTWVFFRILVDRRVPAIVSPLGSLRGWAWLIFFGLQGMAFACIVLGVMQPLATASGDAGIALGRLLPAMSLGCGLGVLLRPGNAPGFGWAWARLGAMVLLWVALQEGHPRWFEQLDLRELGGPVALMTGLLLGGFLQFGLQNLMRDVRWVPPATAAAFWGLGIGHSLGVLWGARMGFSNLPQVGVLLCVVGLSAAHGSHQLVFLRRLRDGLRDSWLH